MPDYKNINLMRRFISDRGKILTMRTSGCCARHQRAIAQEIKKARQIGFIPYTVD
jgi:small subunit ribosomal protein S18